LHHCGFQRVKECATEFGGQCEKIRFVDKKSLGAVGQGESPPAQGGEAAFHADGRCEAAKEEAVRLDETPSTAKHRLEVELVSGEVENGAANDDIGGVIGKAVGLHGLRPEVGGRKLRGEPLGEGLHGADGVRVGIDGVDVVGLAQEEDEVTSTAAACFEHGHSGADSTAEKLIEEVDVDLTEERRKIHHGEIVSS